MRQRSTAGPTLGQRHTRAVRFLSTQTAKVDEATRTIQFPFSSENPVERWFGDEVLSHDPQAADFSRLNDAAPLLFGHNSDDVIGVVESAQILPDRRGYCTVRFAKTPRGDEIVAMVNDGILRNVSFAYRVDQYAPAEDADGDNDCYIATKWMAYEISFVSIPADQSVGVGRSHSNNAQKFKGNTNMNYATEDEKMSRGQRRRNESTLEDERLRVSSINILAERHNFPSHERDELIASGATIADAQRRALDKMCAKKQEPIAWLGTGDYGVGLRDSETRQFSIVKAVRAIVTNDWREAGFERACSRAAGQKIGKETQGFFIPMEVQQRGNWGTRAPYQVGTPGQGGNLVQTSLADNQFTEALRNTSQVLAAGATMFSGFVGNVDVSRRVTTTGTYWVNESAAVTEAEATFDKISFRPKTVGALSKMSRLALMQTTPQIEMLTRNDLIQQVGLAIDLAALSGIGAGGQPLGIANQAGIQVITGGTNGAAVTFDNLISMESALSASNAPWENRAYIMNAATIGSLKKIKSTTGQYLWTMDPPGQRSGTPPNFNGYPTLASNQARSNLNKGTSTGVCSEIFFGAWSELMIAEWGVMEILVNPFDSTGFASGDVLIRALQTMDIQIRHPASFAIMSDALTP